MQGELSYTQWPCLTVLKVGCGPVPAKMVICTVNLLLSALLYSTLTHITYKLTGAKRHNHYLFTSFIADFGMKHTDLPSPFSDSITKVHCTIFSSD